MVNNAGHLAGAISIDDLVLVAQNVRVGADRVSFEQVMEAVEALAERSSKQTRFGVRRPERSEGAPPIGVNGAATGPTRQLPNVEE